MTIGIRPHAAVALVFLASSGAGCCGIPDVYLAGGRADEIRGAIARGVQIGDRADQFEIILASEGFAAPNYDRIGDRFVAKIRDYNQTCDIRVEYQVDALKRLTNWTLDPECDGI